MAAGSETGRVLLFVREFKADRITGGAEAYSYLGTASYVKHEGEKPMNITWKLDAPIPLFPELETLVPKLHMASVYAMLNEFPGASQIANAHLTHFKAVLSDASKGRYEREKAVEINKMSPPILTIPSIRCRTGAMILAKIGDFSRFDSPDKILAYAGLSPLVENFNLSNRYVYATQSALLDAPAEYEAYTAKFYPWNERELTDLVHSRPNSRYYVAAWDFYRDGCFLYTRYCVLSL